MSAAGGVRIHLHRHAACVQLPAQACNHVPYAFANCAVAAVAWLGTHQDPAVCSTSAAAATATSCRASNVGQLYVSGGKGQESYLCQWLVSALIVVLHHTCSCHCGLLACWLFISTSCIVIAGHFPTQFVYVLCNSCSHAVHFLAATTWLQYNTWAAVLVVVITWCLL